MGAKRWMRHISMGMVAILAALAAPVAAHAAEPDPIPFAAANPDDNWSSVYNGNSGLFLAVAGSSNANGAKVVQYHQLLQSNGTPIPDQDWLFVPRGGGYYSLRNAGTSDWKALAVAGHSDENGAKVIQYSYQPSNTDQQWYANPLGDNIFQFINRNSGKCLAIPGGSPDAGVQAIQYTCRVSTEQLWRLHNL